MQRDRFEYLCREAEAGRDAFVRSAEGGQDGMVISCTPEHLVISGSDGTKQCWDYRNCEELSRDRQEWPYR